MSKDLIKSCGKSFGIRNLENFRWFCLSYSHIQKTQTVFAESFKALKSGKLSEIHSKLPDIFPLPWTVYIRLIGIQQRIPPSI